MQSIEERAQELANIRSAAEKAVSGDLGEWYKLWFRTDSGGQRRLLWGLPEQTRLVLTPRGMV